MGAAAVAIALVVSLVVIGVGGPGASDASAQVELGARTTLARNSVALAISGPFTVNCQTIPFTGSGVANLASKLQNLSMSMSINGTSVQDTEIADGSSAYRRPRVSRHRPRVAGPARSRQVDRFWKGASRGSSSPPAMN